MRGLWHQRGAAMLLAALTLAACSGSDDTAGDTTTTTAGSPATSLVTRTESADTAPAGATTVRMAGATFDPSELTVKAGRVVFFLVNDDEPAPPDVEAFRRRDRRHEMALAGSVGVTIALSGHVEPQQAVAMTVESIPPGRYTFRCTIHGQLNMSGTLEVTP